MKRLLIFVSLVLVSACGTLTEQDVYERESQRMEYLESVFLPASQRCSRAGGYLIYADTARHSSRVEDLSYSDMRSAVVRGCAGI